MYINHLPITWPSVPRHRDGAVHFLCVPLGWSWSQAQKKYSIKTRTSIVGRMSEQAEQRASEQQLSASSSAAAAAAAGPRVEDSRRKSHRQPVWFPVGGGFTEITIVMGSIPPRSCLATTSLTFWEWNSFCQYLKSVFSHSSVQVHSDIDSGISKNRMGLCVLLITQGKPTSSREEWMNAKLYLLQYPQMIRRTVNCR